MWAVGLIFYELLTKQRLIEGDCDIEIMFKIFEILGTPNKETTPTLYEESTVEPIWPDKKN